MSSAASGQMTATIQPAPNASCARISHKTPTSGATSATASGRARSPANAGASASAMIARMSNQSGAVRSGSARVAVQIAFAWISGPDMRSSLAAGVACTSWSDGDVAPTTTILPRKTAGSTRPRMRSENETVRIVPGPPR